MTQFREVTRSRSPAARLGGQPIALAAATLVAVLVGAAAIALWRSYTGVSPEPDRAVFARQLQARAAQASEQLAEKTKGLEATQEESIDQLQQVQDQLQTVKRLLAAQQADNKRLSDQVSGLTEAVESLRQSFASAQPSDSSSPPAAHHSSRVHAVIHRRTKSHS
jgi:flagellar motility protein MotE (MotC chaperone)